MTIITLRGAVAMFFLFLVFPLAAEPVSVTPGAPAEDRREFIEQYIDNLLYMVYIDEKIQVPAGDDFLYRRAIAAANDYLARKKMGTVVLDQIENLRRDHTALVEEVQGENMSLVQWLAQKLNADVYIVIDVRAPAEKRGRQYFAQATLNLKVMEASTGLLLGSKSYNQLDRSVGSNAETARGNAVQICVSRIMNDVIEIARSTMREAAEKGIRYELVLLGTQDADAMLDFVEKLKTVNEDVTAVESSYRSDSEAKYVVFYFGAPGTFERLVYAIAETIPGLEGMKLVSQRGKSFTFTTGMQ